MATEDTERTREQLLRENARLRAEILVSRTEVAAAEAKASRSYIYAAQSRDDLGRMAQRCKTLEKRIAELENPEGCPEYPNPCTCPQLHEVAR